MAKTEHSETRIDKWLWAVRLFKTRNQAAEACSKGRVLIGGQAVKPSRHVREGDIISLKRLPVVYTFRVKGLIENRQPARSVTSYLEDITPEQERQKAAHHNTVVFSRREPGTGRPTKKERRFIDKLTGGDQ
jgi:ribosome-associated heat shock protein Hsp15